MKQDWESKAPIWYDVVGLGSSDSDPNLIQVDHGA